MCFFINYRCDDSDSSKNSYMVKTPRDLDATENKVRRRF